MSLFYESKQGTSYLTSQHVLNFLNRALGEKAATLRAEDGGSDAMFYGHRVELKQRQNTYFVEIFEGHKKPHKETTIHKSATEHGSELFIIYDLGLRYVQVFLASDLNEYNSEFNRYENTEVGGANIKYVTVDTDKTWFIDLLDKRGAREAVKLILRKLEDCNKKALS